MTVELPSEIAEKLNEEARSQGITVVQYIERLVSEANLRRAQTNSEPRLLSGLRR